MDNPQSARTASTHNSIRPVADQAAGFSVSGIKEIDEFQARFDKTLPGLLRWLRGESASKQNLFHNLEPKRAHQQRRNTMRLPAVGLTKLSPNKITFQIRETEILEGLLGPTANSSVAFAKVTIVFHIPVLGDVEKKFDLFAVPHDNGEYMKMRIGRTMIPGQGALFADITSALWRVPEISESFMRAFEQHQEKFRGGSSS